MDISEATHRDAGEILTLQKIAFLPEARLYGNHDIAPLTQTIEEMQAGIARMTVLKAVSAGEIVGSVRGGTDGGICRVGRLVVHPGHQRRGIGLRLMHQLEERFTASCEWFEIFTGHRSGGPLSLYAKLGYRKFREEFVRDGLTLIFLRKPSQGKSEVRL